MTKTVLSVLMLAASVAPAFADLPVAYGENDRFDRSRIPSVFRTKYDLFQAKCSGCHSLERVVISYKSGILPLSGAPFDLQTMRGIIISMMQKSSRGKSKSGQISRDEARDCMSAMSFLLDESVR